MSGFFHLWVLVISSCRGHAELRELWVWTGCCLIFCSNSLLQRIALFLLLVSRQYHLFFILPPPGVPVWSAVVLILPFLEDSSISLVQVLLQRCMLLSPWTTCPPPVWYEQLYRSRVEQFSIQVWWWHILNGGSTHLELASSVWRNLNSPCVSLLDRVCW